MSQSEDWPARVVKVIAGQVRRYRDLRKMSGQDLADACEAIGHKIPRSILANLENGRRPTISVPELLALAKALRVPPALLVFPLGHSDTVEILPDRQADTWRALLWFTGEMPFTDDLTVDPSNRDRVKVDDADAEGWRDRGKLVNMFRGHQAYLVEILQARRDAAMTHQEAESLDPNDSGRDSLLRAAAAHGATARALERMLRFAREALREKGVKLPELPQGLQHIDDPSSYEAEGRYSGLAVSEESEQR